VRRPLDVHGAYRVSSHGAGVVRVIGKSNPQVGHAAIETTVPTNLKHLGDGRPNY
jgi:hypothetical protein